MSTRQAGSVEEEDINQERSAARAELASELQIELYSITVS